jgi:hypothetical protein
MIVLEDRSTEPTRSGPNLQRCSCCGPSVKFGRGRSRFSRRFYRCVFCMCGCVCIGIVYNLNRFFFSLFVHFSEHIRSFHYRNHLKNTFIIICVCMCVCVCVGKTNLKSWWEIFLYFSFIVDGQRSVHLVFLCLQTLRSNLMTGGFMSFFYDFTSF